MPSANAELTTEEAAAVLNVSRPFLTGHLDEGKISFRFVGTRRRINARHLITYKHSDDAERSAALDELAAESQRLGLY